MNRSKASRLISAVSATALILSIPVAPIAVAQDLSANGVSPADCAALGFGQQYSSAGTNIAGVKAVGSPIQRLSREDILKTGATNLRDVLSALPPLQAGGAVQNAAPAAPTTDGSTSIDIGGQGSRATLVLVDGQRTAQPGQNSTFTDVNQVPLSALGAVEVIPNGASVIYGTDAISGVVNLTVRPSGPTPPAPVAIKSTESYPNAVTNPVKQVAADPVSTFSIDVDTASYSNVRRFLNDGQRPPTDSVRVEEMVNYFDYNYPLPTSKDEPFRPFVAVAPSPFNAGRRIIHIGLQGYALPRAVQPPLNLVFLVDTSGSMYSADRLPLAQQALNVLIDQLRPQDHVSLVSYAGSAGLVLPPTAGSDKARIRCAVNALQSGGSTAGGAGLSLAYSVAKRTFEKDGVNRIVLMTDGDFNVGTTDNRTLEAYVADQRKSGVYLSVYGFGRGNYQDNRMQTIAQNGNGTAAYIDNLSEARKLFRDDFSGSVFPIADDVKIQVEFNPARVSEYRLIGYETRMLNREDFNNDAVDAGEVGSGASVTALYEVTPVGGSGSVDPLRYAAPKPAAGSPTGELAFLKVRYKTPGGTQSRLIQRAITDSDETASLAAAPEATRFAVAVAGFGEKLRGDSSLSPSFTWTADRDLALGARGDDSFGLRSEFVQLTRAAEQRAVASN